MENYPNMDDSYYDYYVRDGYIKGATDQKAIDDEEYRKDMRYVGVKREELIDRACDYLRAHIDPKLVIYHDNTWRSLDEFIEQFRKAMKE